MSQLASRATALAAAPLSNAGAMVPLDPSTPDASALIAAVAAPTATPARGDAVVASPAAEVVAREAKATTKAASADSANGAAPAPAPAVAAGVRVTPEGTAAVDATDAAAATTTATAAPAVSLGVPSKQITTTHVASPARAPSPATAGSIGGAVLALVLVVGLILLLAWLAKRMPGLGGTGTNPSLRIVGSLALGPRERVVVVAVGDTQLLLGVGAGGTRALHTLTEPLPVATAATPAFAQLLAQHFGKKA